MVPDGYEVFYVSAEEFADADEDTWMAEYVREQGDGDATDTAEYLSGWYWWSCQPGCLPDGDPSGPWDTEEEAIADLTWGTFEEEDET